MAQPRKLRTPNQIASEGKARSVTAVTRRPQRLMSMPRRSAFFRPQDQTNPEIRIKLQQIDCCHRRLAGRLYQEGSLPKTMKTS